mmetsp:Transcript_25364/g.54750  ORF Transcript_25364/g.54750 Transcript_25364/m.54750 type:complete len:524 (-) Transcript_25364:5079-6650(-)
MNKHESSKKMRKISRRLTSAVGSAVTLKLGMFCIAVGGFFLLIPIFSLTSDKLISSAVVAITYEKMDSMNTDEKSTFGSEKIEKLTLRNVDGGKIIEESRMSQFEIDLFYCERHEVPHLRWFVDSYIDERKRRDGVQVSVKEVLLDKHAVFRKNAVSIIYYNRSLSPRCIGETTPEFRDALAASRMSTNHSNNVVAVNDPKEVFGGDARCMDRYAEPYGGVDLLFDRSLGRNFSGDCTKIHFLQGLEYTTRDHSAGVGYDIKRLCKQHTLEDVMADLEANPRPYNTFLATARLIKRSHHPADALVRSSLFSLLAEEFGNELVQGTKFVRIDLKGSNYTTAKCDGPDVNVANCKRSFKFSIDMENTSEQGYVSEKVFTGFLAGTIPIYFGAPDIHRYLNPKRFINCKLPTDVLNEFRSFKHGSKFRFPNSEPNPLHNEKVNYLRIHDDSVKFLRPHLQSCLEKVRRVNDDDELYFNMLTQNVFKDQEIICAQDPINFDVGEQLYRYFSKRGLLGQSGEYAATAL